MILFTLMLGMILKAQRTGRIPNPLLASTSVLDLGNLHIQFIYGWRPSVYISRLMPFSGLRPCASGSIHFSDSFTFAVEIVSDFISCLAASLIGPYSYRLFIVVLKYSQAKQTYSVIEELQSPSFTSFTNFIFLFILMAAFYAVGFRRKIDAFQISL